MIEVKGTKSETQNTDPSDIYRLEAEKKSRSPFAIGVALIGIALYLKSMVSAEAEPYGGPAPAPAKALRGPAAEAASQAAEAEPAAAEDGDRAQRAPDPITAGPEPTSGHMEPAVAPTQLGVRLRPLLPASAEAPSWRSVDAPPVETRVANDNMTRSTGHGGGGGGGGSGSRGEPDVDPTDPDGEEDDDHTSQVNRAPRVAGAVTLRDVSGGTILAIALTHLLQNASDPDGQVLAVKNLAVSSGSLTPAAGGWLYQAGPQPGPVTLTYQVTDGTLSVDQTATFSVVGASAAAAPEGDAALLGMAAERDRSDDEGEAAEAVMAGGQGAEAVAGESDDVRVGSSGDDAIHGGAGMDRILGGAGDDSLFGHGGNDIISGEDGDDQLSGGSGDDLLSGGLGNDFVVGDTGNDRIEGGAGNDRIDGGAGEDTLGGDDGDDVIDGGEGDDRIEGGAGDDLLSDGTGEDLVFAGIGNDTLVVTLAAEADRYDGGAGSDTLDYSAASQGLTIDLVAGTGSGLEVGEDTISGFETIVGGSGDDHFVVGDAAMVLVGGAGENEFEFSFESTSGQSYSVIHEIMDFKVGDTIRMSKYDIFEKVLLEIGDQLADVYGEHVEANETSIRYRHEKGEGVDRTLIEADFDKDDIYETTIELQGHHALVIVEHV